MSSEIFGQAAFEAAQPYHLVWDNQGIPINVSAALRDIWKVEDIGSLKVNTVRPFKGELLPEFFDELTDVLLEIHPVGQPELSFKGQIILVGKEHFLFVGSPSVAEHHELSRYGISLSDLPLHERLGDLIIANEANQIALKQARESETQVHEVNLALIDTNRIFQKFVPSEFIHALGLSKVTDVQLGQHVSTELCVLFGDLRNFSTLSEALDPAEVMRLVILYLTFVTPAIQESGGHIVQYQGDGVLAVFPNGVAAGIRASQKMQEAIRACGREYFPDDPNKLKMGIGLHLGQVEMGIIGNEDRWESTVISDAVNTAARIESLTKALGAEVLISDVVYKAFEGRHSIETRRLGEFDVKGRTNKVVLREVLSSLAPEQRELKLGTREVFERGVEALTKGDVSEAVLAFDEVIRKNPLDIAARVLQRKILQGALVE